VVVLVVNLLVLNLVSYVDLFRTCRKFLVGVYTKSPAIRVSMFLAVVSEAKVNLTIIKEILNTWICEA
jgi:hypothetical protein